MYGMVVVVLPLETAISWETLSALDDRTWEW